MANTMYSVFERLWYHVTAKLGEKANISHKHSVSDISDTLPIEKGGTGATTVSDALTALKLSGVQGLTILSGSTEVITATSSSATEYIITFNKTFSSTPVVVASLGYGNAIAGMSQVSVYVSSNSKTSVTFQIANNSTTNRKVRIKWIAVGTV